MVASLGAVAAPAATRAWTDGATHINVGPGFPSAGVYPPVAGQPLIVEVAPAGTEYLAGNFTDTVRISTTDPQATVQIAPGGASYPLPLDYGFDCVIPYVGCNDFFGHDFTFTFRTAGPQTISVHDVSAPSIAGSWAINVAPGAASSLTLSNLPATSTAGARTTIKATVKDALGNVATSYTGTVRMSSTDPSAVLPADHTFTAGEQGVTWLDVRLMSTGSRSVTVTDIANATLTNAKSTTVTAAAHINFEITAPDNIFAGYYIGGLLQAMTAANVLDPAYRGTVQFTSSDPLAELPGDYPFTAGAAGSDNYILGEVKFKTAGRHTLTATDIANPLITGSVVIDVKGGTVATIALENVPGTMTAGSTPTFTVVVRDAYGNLAQDIKKVHFTSTDAQAALPADFTFHAADYGRHQFTLGLRTAGPQTLTGVIVGYPAITTTKSVAVLPGNTAALAVSGLPPAVTGGEANALTVQARDAWGNAAHGYTGTVHFTSTDPTATLPANYAFTLADHGAKGFMVTLRTGGTRSVTATDVASPGITGTQAGITVSLADTSPPAATVTTPAADTKATDVVYTVAFSEAVTGLAAGDFTRTGTATGCTVGAPAGSGSSYTVAVTGCSEGTLGLTLKANSVLDAASNTGPTANVAGTPGVTLDRSGPVISSLRISPLVGARLSGTAVPVVLTWQASDVTGIHSYAVLRSADGGATWTTLAGSHQTTSYPTTVSTTGSVRFGVIGTDTLSTSGAMTWTATFSPRLVQQSSSAVSWGGTWKKATGSSWSGGSAKYASTKGRSATYKVTGRAVALVALKAPTRGKLRIYVGRTYQTTIDLSKVTAAAYRTVVWQATWSSVRTRTIKVVVVGTGSHPRVDVDAFVAFK